MRASVLTPFILCNAVYVSPLLYILFSGRSSSGIAISLVNGDVQGWGVAFRNDIFRHVSSLHGGLVVLTLLAFEAVAYR